MLHFHRMPYSYVKQSLFLPLKRLLELKLSFRIKITGNLSLQQSHGFTVSYQFVLIPGKDIQ
jgi:hypothetical protein